MTGPIALLASLLASSGGAHAGPPGSSPGDSPRVDPPAETLEVATLGGGCFWCLEAVYQDVRGVHEVVSGYAGGALADPTYEQVCSGATGHAEVVQIHYDPTRITYQDLLEVFWAIHDPTTPNRQGADVGTQYRSIILYHDQEQLQQARTSVEQAQASGRYRGRFSTEILPLEAFYPAEDHHQDYFARNPDKPYCAIVVTPKIDKFRKEFDRLRE